VNMDRAIITATRAAAALMRLVAVAARYDRPRPLAIRAIG
jgi:hypothetical protein